jgi:signal transduction histidine kinase
VQRDLSRSIEKVAHDIRNPLASLLGFTNLLEREFGELLESSGLGYIDNLRSNIDRVQEQLERLIELGRIPERELERSRILSNAVFTEIAQELKPELDRGGISLSLPADPQSVYANKQRFHQVVLNLVVNAIQHMGDVSEPEIRIDLKPVDGGHLLVVEDNGLGLPPEEHLRVFDLFRSARFGMAARSGGLGLSIVQRIMAAHGGSIELDSRPGQGAIFKAFFPDRVSS